MSSVWPIAIITVSTFIVNSEPATGFGRRLPELSGSPRTIRMHSIESTLPFRALTLTGAAKN